MLPRARADPPTARSVFDHPPAALRPSSMDAKNQQAHGDRQRAVGTNASRGRVAPAPPSGAAPSEETRLPRLRSRTAALEAELADLTARQRDALREFAAVPAVAARLEKNADPESSPDAAGDVDKDAALKAAKAIIQERIRLLHEYNEIRDIGQGLMGIIAESRGVRIKDVQEQFSISAKD